MAHDPNLILTIKAADPFSAEAIFFPHNRDRRVLAEDDDDGLATPSSSRQATPEFQQPTTEPTRLELRFDKPPKDIKEGFVFGSDPNTCDVLVGQKSFGVSGKHFAINFDNRSRLILKSISRRGVAVSYDGKGSGQRRKDFTWILFPGRKVKVHVRDRKRFVYTLEQPDLSGHDVEREKRLKSYLARYNGSLLSFNPLNNPAHDQQAVYAEGVCLGSGTFGTVYKAVNVSTGDQVALKRFNPETTFANEVKIMKSISHDHIVKYIDFIEEPNPGLAMEYLPLGSLENHKVDDKEARTLFLQMIQAIEYLHKVGVAHRDIKPANILIQRKCGYFFAKLSDFGFAKSSEALQSICGSETFLAPEIWEAAMSRRPTRYTNAVDIWSLGVVMVSLFRHLPKCPRTKDNKIAANKGRSGKAARRLDRCGQIVEEAAELWNGNTEDPLFFILTKMLVIKDSDRLKASECLRIYMERAPTPTPLPEENVATTPVARVDTIDRNDVTNSAGPGDVSRMALETYYDLERHGAIQSDQSYSEFRNLKQRGPGSPMGSITIDRILGPGNDPAPFTSGKRKHPRGDSSPEMPCGRVRKRHKESVASSNTSVYVTNWCRSIESPDQTQKNIEAAIVRLLRDMHKELKPFDEGVSRDTNSLARGLVQYIERLGISQLQLKWHRSKIEIWGMSKGREMLLLEQKNSEARSMAGLSSALLLGLQRQKATSNEENDHNRCQRNDGNDQHDDLSKTLRNEKCVEASRTTAYEIHECTIKEKTVHFRPDDQKICFDELARAAGRSRPWINKNLDEIPPESKEVCEYGTLVDFYSALPAIKILGVKLAVRNATGMSEMPPTMQEFRGKMYTYIKIGLKLVHLCEAEKRVNASHLIKVSGKGRGTRNEALESCGITDIEQVFAHPTLQGAYIRYEDGRKLCEYLRLEVPDAICEGDEQRSSSHVGSAEILAETRNPFPVSSSLGENGQERERSRFPSRSRSPNLAPQPPAEKDDSPNPSALSRILVHNPREDDGDDGEKGNDPQHMDSRRSYWDSSRSYLSLKNPDYTAASVGPPLEGLSMSGCSLLFESRLFGSNELS